MKHTKIFNLTIAILLSCFLLTSCNANSKEHSEEEETKSVLSDQANPIIVAYLQLKDDLVETDAKKAQKSATKFISTLNDEEGERVEIIRDAAEKIAASGDVNVQREHFGTLSDELYAYAQTTEMGVNLYRQYCPMAFQNKGAYWLSSESKIMNPYFGDKMLHCGVVKDEF